MKVYILYACYEDREDHREIKEINRIFGSEERANDYLDSIKDDIGFYVGDTYAEYYKIEEVEVIE